MEKPLVCLVIENDKDFRELISAVLTRVGFEVDAVASGAHGIAAAASNSAISLISLEPGLPDMDGHDVARALRALTRAPLLFVTARTDQDDMLAAMASGAAAYLAKPFSPRELARMAKDLVPLTQRR